MKVMDVSQIQIFSHVQCRNARDDTFTSESLDDYTENSFRSIPESLLQHFRDTEEKDLQKR